MAAFDPKPTLQNRKPLARIGSRRPHVTDGASSRVPVAPEGALNVSPRSRQSLSTRPNEQREHLPKGYRRAAARSFPRHCPISAIGTKRTWQSRSLMSAFGGEADMRVGCPAARAELQFIRTAGGGLSSVQCRQ